MKLNERGVILRALRLGRVRLSPPRRGFQQHWVPVLEAPLDVALPTDFKN